MGDDDKKSQDAPRREISQIPLLNEIVFDSSLPLKPPPRPRRTSRKQPPGDHGPDYDPGTLDLFETPDSHLQSLVENQTEEFRADALRMIDELVEEYSAEITQRLRAELTEQLRSILDDLTDTTNGELDQ
ncbi:MAG: hypothetical protein O6945_02950 [Gammaproteobacteria bacterium]|nr:hypothetical protein [Gammaproteobacteria bacterium]